MITKFYIFSFDTFFKLNNFSLIFTILCILCLINSLNLADGINGLATGLIFFWLIYISQIYENNLQKEKSYRHRVRPDAEAEFVAISIILLFPLNAHGNSVAFSIGLRRSGLRNWRIFFTFYSL